MSHDNNVIKYQCYMVSMLCGITVMWYQCYVVSLLYGINVLQFQYRLTDKNAKGLQQEVDGLRAQLVSRFSFYLALKLSYLIFLFLWVIINIMYSR